jgi:S-formylglutathione hydrolase FrmB
MDLEPMIEFQTTYYSSAVGLHLGARILVPESGPRGKATLYLLHGLSDDHSIWHRRSSVERYVEPCDAVIVMPYGGRGFYTNADHGSKWGDAIGSELIAKIEDWFGVSTSSEHRYIAGLSMGGYGAFRLALSNPGVYGHAASMSGALMIGSQALNNPLRSAEYDEELRRIFADNPVGTHHDLLHLATQCASTGQLPNLWMDCGTSDFLFDDNQTFYARITEMNMPIRYEVSEGSHDWQYWNRLLPDVLRWMGLTPAA